MRYLVIYYNQGKGERPKKKKGDKNYEDCNGYTEMLV